MDSEQNKLAAASEIAADPHLKAMLDELSAYDANDAHMSAEQVAMHFACTDRINDIIERQKAQDDIEAIKLFTTAYISAVYCILKGLDQ